MGYNGVVFKKLILIVSIGVIALIITSYFLLRNRSEIPPEFQDLGPNLKTININGLWLIVEIADEPHEQAQGLSGRDEMAEHRGMLFVFPEPLVPSFWMKDMSFSLDMLWIDADGKIIAITKNISPDTFPKTFQPPSPIKYVLEVNSGWSARNNIKVGDKITF